MIESDKRDLPERTTPEQRVLLPTPPLENRPDNSLSINNVGADLSLLEHPSSSSLGSGEGWRGMNKMANFVDAGIWLARTAASGLVTVAAGVGSYNLLVGGSNLYAAGCAVITAGAAWLTFRMVKAAWQTARGEGMGII